MVLCQAHRVSGSCILGHWQRPSGGAYSAYCSHRLPVSPIILQILHVTVNTLCYGPKFSKSADWLHILHINFNIMIFLHILLIEFFLHIVHIMHRILQIEHMGLHYIYIYILLNSIIHIMHMQ